MSKLSLCALLILSACSNETKPGDAACPEGQLQDGGGTCRKTCTTTADCADATLACEPHVKLCLPAEQVTCDPELCAEGTVCPPDGGLECVSVDSGDNLCIDDEDCPFGTRCEDSECVSRVGDIVQTCTIDAECGLLMTCQLGVCLGCLDDIQCNGGTCVAGTCVIAEVPPALNCLTAECVEGERCNPITGLCEPTCTENTDCEVDQMCMPLLGQCTAKFGCEGEDDCNTSEAPGGISCILGLCVGCAGNEECNPATERCVAGALGSVCLPTFTAPDLCGDVTCGVDELCDPADGSCYPADGQCEDADDCQAGQSCNFLGLCAGCSATEDCRPEQSCILNTCVPPIEP